MVNYTALGGAAPAVRHSRCARAPVAYGAGRPARNGSSPSCRARAGRPPCAPVAALNFTASPAGTGIRARDWPLMRPSRYCASLCASPAFACLVLTEVNPTYDADGSQLRRYISALVGVLAGPGLEAPVV